MALFYLIRKRMVEAMRVTAGFRPEFEPKHTDDIFNGGLISHALRFFI